MIAWPEDIRSLCLPRGANSQRMDRVARQLARILGSGQLAAFIGTGVSKIVGLPMWGELNRRVVEVAPEVLGRLFPAEFPILSKKLPSVDDLTSSPDDLKVLDRVERVCSGCESLRLRRRAEERHFIGDAPSWRQVVRQALYGDLKAYDFESMFDCELVSLCSLMTGGSRGSVKEVVTFNYDDLLESYLNLQGCAYHVVTPLPNKLTPNDCTVFYHPHGYLPLQDSDPSSYVVLSNQSCKKFCAHQGSRPLWRNYIAWLLTVRVGLFLGISGNDAVMQHYLDHALSVNPGTAPLAFALLLGDYLAPEEWMEKRVIPLEFEDPHGVAEFIARVCHHAARPIGHHRR